MFKYILRRLLASVIVMFCVVVVAFTLLRVATGNPALMLLPDGATDEEIAMMEESLGINKSYIAQFWDYFSGLFRGDFGTSLTYRLPCMEVILGRFPRTLELALAGAIVATLLAIPIGIIAGVHQGTGIDLAAMGFALIFQSMSTIWLGVLLVLIFSVKLDWLPSMGTSDFKSIILPALTIGLPMAGETTRMARSGIIDVLKEDYITATYARGISRSAVYTKYALKNALIPVITLLGMSTAGYLGGAVVCETIFTWPGIGGLVRMALAQRDYPLVQTLLLCFSGMIAIMNLLIDIINSYVDRRIVLK